MHAILGPRMAAPGKSPTVVYALDSADLDLLEGWMGEGRLPHIAELWRNSARRRIGGPGYWDEIGTWITAYSGVPATRHGYYSARRLKPGTYNLEVVPLTSAKARPCWESIQDPDFKALILEPIEGFPSSRVAGAQLYNLTAHQEAYAAAPVIAIPSPVETQTRRIYGKRHVPPFDRFDEPVNFYEQQLATNLDMLRRKSLLFRDLIRSNEFNLLVVGINLHDVVHMLWPFQEGRHDPRDPEGRLAHGIRTFYEEADREIGEIRKLLPDDATQVLLSMYGVKDQYPTLELGTRLMELLGYHVPPASNGNSRDPVSIARRVLPEPLRFQLSQKLPAGLQQSLVRSAFAQNMDFERSRAFVLPTSLFTSHVRINLKGREPTGCVDPGHEYEGLLDEIEAEFRAVIDPVTGQSAVGSVLRTANAFIDGPSELLPDLYVHWKSSRHFLRASDSSERRGPATAPQFFPRFLSSGTGLRGLYRAWDRMRVVRREFHSRYCADIDGTARRAAFGIYARSQPSPVLNPTSMRILLVNDYGTLNGGAEAQMFGLRDGLTARGHETRILASSAGKGCGDPIVDYRALGTTSSLRTLLQTVNPWAASAFLGALRDFRPDVVHLNLFLTQLSPFILPVLRLPAFRNVPCVYYAQWQRAICPTGTRLLPGGAMCRVPWGRDCYRNGCLPMRDWAPLMLQMRTLGAWIGSVDRIVAISNFIRERLEEAHFENIDVIHGGVPMCAARPLLSGPPRIGFAGRLVPEKGLDVLLCACHLLIRDFPQLKLDIAGEGPATASARALVEELGLGDSVTFYGTLSQAKMERVLSRAWVQAIPSVWEEPFGMVAVEAAMRGTAAVASGTGGLAEVVIDGETGLHVAAGDSESLAEALKILLGNKALSERMGAAARLDALARLSLDRHVERFIDLYENLLAARRHL